MVLIVVGRRGFVAVVRLFRLFCTVACPGVTAFHGSTIGSKEKSKVTLAMTQCPMVEHCHIIGLVLKTVNKQSTITRFRCLRRLCLHRIVVLNIRDWWDSWYWPVPIRAASWRLSFTQTRDLWPPLAPLTCFRIDQHQTHCHCLAIGGTALLPFSSHRF